MISSAEIEIPSSARQAASVRQAITSLSTSTPSQSKITSSGCTPRVYQPGRRLRYRGAPALTDPTRMLLFRRLCLAALLLLPCAASAPAPRAVPAAAPLSRLDLPWWRARFEAKQEELR